jgi:hypothetical protein
MSEEPKYPGQECGLSEDEWVLEYLADEIRRNSSLEGMAKLRWLLDFCNIETNSLTAEFIKGYKRFKS